MPDPPASWSCHAFLVRRGPRCSHVSSCFELRSTRRRRPLATFALRSSIGLLCLVFNHKRRFLRTSHRSSPRSAFVWRLVVTGKHAFPSDFLQYMRLLPSPRRDDPRAGFAVPCDEHPSCIVNVLVLVIGLSSIGDTSRLQRVTSVSRLTKTWLRNARIRGPISDVIKFYCGTPQGRRRTVRIAASASFGEIV